MIYSTEHQLEPARVVKPGETLDTIAKEYNVPSQLLAKINGIPADRPASTRAAIESRPRSVRRRHRLASQRTDTHGRRPLCGQVPRHRSARHDAHRRPMARGSKAGRLDDAPPARAPTRRLRSRPTARSSSATPRQPRPGRQRSSSPAARRIGLASNPPASAFRRRMPRKSRISCPSARGSWCGSKKRPLSVAGGPL